MRKWLVLLLFLVPLSVFGQTLDRTHINYHNPLVDGSGCNSTTLNAAISAIGSSTPTTLMMTYTNRARTGCTWTPTASVTVPSNITLWFPPGSDFDCNGQTIAINGPINAGDYQIFTNCASGLTMASGLERSAWFPNLDDAITAAGANNTTIYVNGSTTIGASDTVPGNILLRFADGAYLDVATGIVVNFAANSDIVDTMSKIFSCVAGENCVTFASGAGAASHDRPEWWGAIRNDGLDDLEAFDRHIGALDLAGGGHVIWSQGYYNWSEGLDITDHEALHISGANQPWSTSPDQTSGTKIVLADSATTSAIYGDNARHLTIEDVALRVATDGAAGANVHGISLSSSAGFGCHFDIERVSLWWFHDGIRTTGACTSVKIGKVFLRGMLGDGIHDVSPSGWSTAVLEQIYISSPGGIGLNLEDGCGNCTFEGVITENSGSYGSYFDGLERSSNLSTYGGDSTGDAAFYLKDSKFNFFSAFYANAAGDSIGSTITLDGAHANTFDGGLLSGSDRYHIEWLNNTPVDSKTLRKNVFYNLGWSSMSDLGFTNDWSYIEVHNVAPLSRDTRTTTAPINTNYGSAYWWEQSLQDYWSLRSPDVPTNRVAVGYPSPIGDERWSFFRNFPGLDDFSLMNRSNGTIGVMTSTESLGSSLITGDDSDCDTVGNWTDGATDTVTSVAGGVAGNACSWNILGSGSSSPGIYLDVSGLTTGAQYKLSFSAKIVPQSGSSIKVIVTVYNDANTVALATTEQMTNDAAYREIPPLYFVADGTTTTIRMERFSSTSGDVVLFDNFALQEVQSTGKQCLAGGRLAGTGEGGGGTVCVYGDQHASKPSVTDLDGSITYGTVTTLDDTGTPSVKGHSMFVTGGTTAITDFDDGILGQCIKIRSAHAVTLTDADGTLQLSGSANFVMAADDTIDLCMFEDQVWDEVSRKVD